MFVGRIPRFLSRIWGNGGVVFPRERIFGARLFLPGCGRKCGCKASHFDMLTWNPKRGCSNSHKKETLLDMVGIWVGPWAHLRCFREHHAPSGPGPHPQWRGGLVSMALMEGGAGLPNSSCISNLRKGPRTAQNPSCFLSCSSCSLSRTRNRPGRSQMRHAVIPSDTSLTWQHGSEDQPLVHQHLWSHFRLEVSIFCGTRAFPSIIAELK